MQPQASAAQKEQREVKGPEGYAGFHSAGRVVGFLGAAFVAAAFDGK
jgi:hypothetical protein